jgi:trk system potassium uptake protein TrkA
MVRVHIIIVGCGRVGSGLGVGLVEQGHSVVILDRNPKAFRRLPTDWAGTTVVGSGFDRDVLDRARAGEAAALAAVTSGDNSNILTARIARETYEIPHVVARIYDPRRARIYLRLGISTVATVAWTIDQVQRRLNPGDIEGEWSDPTGTLSLVERELPERWAGKRLADLTVPGEVTLVAVTRAGVARLDFNDLVGQDGDVLHLMVADASLERLHARMVGTPAAGIHGADRSADDRTVTGSVGADGAGADSAVTDGGAAHAPVADSSVTGGRS